MTIQKEENAIEELQVKLSVDSTAGVEKHTVQKVP